LPRSAIFDHEEAKFVQYVTSVASESRTHLTDNGAVTLCGRAITHTWRRGERSDECACPDCDARAAAIGRVQVAARREGAAHAERQAVPA
jgi:hypothetical protein